MMAASNSVVMPGLDPGIYLALVKVKMNCRVK
jgi:hypothetical protein